jgi:predicted unusual protein kinase regulating ubiquinone biosynthesis (AarF/ABC1/UbiB family)
MASVVHPALGIGWINGARLDTSEQDDVPRLCAVALAAYLAMLLDIGVLHADPHPGNLFRTDDGKLCILDW